MENYLINYLNKRLGEYWKTQIPGIKTAGPLITITREVGCGGLSISKQLAEELDKTFICKKWQVISKEVLNESAHELKVAPEKVSRLFTSNEHFTFDEILAAFTDKYYKSNRVILKTVREVIRNFAVDGYCIIVGRAGHIIAADVENSLHIRLTAPLQWRISRIAENKNFSADEAVRYIKETEEERDIFRKYFTKDKKNEGSIDLVINVSRFTPEQIVRIIVQSFVLKCIPENIRANVPFV